MDVNEITTNALIGAAAGCVATVPMTAAMVGMKRLLPARERYPLPPRLITMKIADEAGVKDHLSPPAKSALTMLSHFGYGAATGALYGAITEDVGAGPISKGIGFGLLVWSASYLGWIPAAGILPPATDQPARRNLLMIVAHVIWGAVTGIVFERVLNTGCCRRA